MKQLIVILLLFQAIVSVNAQTIGDKSEVIQKCLDLDSLQTYLVDIKKDSSSLFIMNNGVLPKNIKLNKFGKPVVFINIEVAHMRNVWAMTFMEFEISNTNAKVVFYYSEPRIETTVILEKKDEHWIIKKYEIKLL